MSNFSIFYQQPLGFFKGGVIGLAKAVAIGVPKALAKGVIHTARFFWDFGTDILKFGGKLYNFITSGSEQEGATIEEIDANAQRVKDIIDANAKHAKDIIAKHKAVDSVNSAADGQAVDNSKNADSSYWGQVKVSLDKAKNATVDTWYEKDSMIMGQVSNKLTNYPIIKGISDVVCLGCALVKTAGVELVNIAASTNTSALESAYAAGEVKTDHTLSPMDIDPIADYVPRGSVGDGFALVDLSEKECIEMATVREKDIEPTSFGGGDITSIEEDIEMALSEKAVEIVPAIGGKEYTDMSFLLPEEQFELPSLGGVNCPEGFLGG